MTTYIQHLLILLTEALAILGSKNKAYGLFSKLIEYITSEVTVLENRLDARTQEVENLERRLREQQETIRDLERRYAVAMEEHKRLATCNRDLTDPMVEMHVSCHSNGISRIFEGQFIDAIKVLRSMSELGLAEAKGCVSQLASYTPNLGGPEKEARRLQALSETVRPSIKMKVRFSCIDSAEFMKYFCVTPPAVRQVCKNGT